jgi:hypothetical protein
LLEFNASVGNALFGTSHSPSPSLSSDEFVEESDEEDNEDTQTQRSNSSSLSIAGGILSIWTHGFTLHNGSASGRANIFFPHPFSITEVHGGRSGTVRHVTAGLTFTDPVDEAHFQRWHARHRLQFDVVALSMCVLFHTLLVFTNIGHVTIFKAVEPWRWAVGYVQLLLLLFLSNKRSRAVYIQHRDKFLLALLAIVLWYHHFVMRNFLGVAPSLQKCSGVIYGFLWIPFSTLVLQARFKWLMPAIVLTTSINLTLLGEICAACGEGVGNGGLNMTATTVRRCTGRGVSKVAIMVGAALCTVYCLEWRARRVWAALRGPTR